MQHWLLILLLVVTSCWRPVPGALTAAVHADATLLAGQVRWHDGDKLAIAALPSEIASSATVSLIDPATGQTVATTLTRSDGAFSLTMPNWRPTSDQPYVLEAMKGLSAGGNPNRVGAPAARLRTVVSKVNNQWTSLTGSRIQISRSTTAVAAIADLKGLASAQIQLLLSCITIGNPDLFTSAAGITQTEYDSVWLLVNSALLLNQDPIRNLARNTGDGSFMLLERGPLVTDFSAGSGASGGEVILYGNGFDPLNVNNIVRFAGVEASNVTVDAGGTQLRVSVPPGAVTGPLTLRVGNVETVVTSIFRIQGTTIDTYAGTTAPPIGALASQWAIAGPLSIAINAAGELLVCTAFMVYRIAADGTIGAVAGNGLAGYSGDGGPATSARLGGANGIALDAAGNLYIADTGNYRIRKVNTGGIITTVAGNGNAGYSGDGGLATSASLQLGSGTIG
ncbi:MAG: hypothetical protein HY692_03620, partial [Cyanobacteria bacterium NC_groundwater_1444_Ag_S-0.65um_54_12]|nr:hypothetical protein [Cyanobacteria bacterium NC_groundwater_1444_Ag_S-0.65um_54_12]